MKCKEKVGYKSRSEAEKVKKFPFFKKDFRVYLCPDCFKWHLTMNTKKQQ